MAITTKKQALASLAKDLELVRLYERNLYTGVQIAREQGASWADIGEVLGVTRQAAQERFNDVRVERKLHG